jgi:hypothetical protein
MVISFTSLQNFSGITLKKIGLIKIVLNLGPVTASPSALFDHRAVASKVF